MTENPDTQGYGEAPTPLWIPALLSTHSRQLPLTPTPHIHYHLIQNNCAIDRTLHENQNDHRTVNQTQDRRRTRNRRFPPRRNAGSLRDFRICHRLQAARLLTTYGNEDAPNFIDDNPQESRSDRNGHRPSRPTKFDTELARLIRENTDDGRSIARFLVNVMVGDFRSFRPHHRMAAARELLDRGFGKSARNETPPPDPGNPPGPMEIPGPFTDDNNEITIIPESHESQFRQSTDLLDDIDCERCHCLIDRRPRRHTGHPRSSSKAGQKPPHPPHLTHRISLNIPPLP